MIEYVQALSLRQPAAYAVCHLGQRFVSMPTWRSESGGALAAARGLVGTEILLHAAHAVGSRDTFMFACDMIVGIRGPTVIPRLVKSNLARVAWPPAASLPRMALVARARLVAVARTTPGGHRHRLGPTQDCLLCGLHRPGDDVRCTAADPWAQPGIGLELGDVVPLQAPVQFKGHGAWFRVPVGEVHP